MTQIGEMHILFVTATRIGDAVLSTGLLSYLIERYPAACLTVAAGPVAAPLFEALPNLERLVVIDSEDDGGDVVQHGPRIYQRRKAVSRGTKSGPGYQTRN